MLQICSNLSSQCIVVSSSTQRYLDVVSQYDSFRRREQAPAWVGLQAWAAADVSDLTRLLSRFAEDVTDHGGPGPVPGA